MLGINSSGAGVGRGNLRNNLAYTGTLTSNMTGSSSAYNSWDLGVTLSDSQFQSVSTTGWDALRQADGSLPALPYLHLASGLLADLRLQQPDHDQNEVPDSGQQIATRFQNYDSRLILESMKEEFDGQYGRATQQGIINAIRSGSGT